MIQHTAKRSCLLLVILAGILAAGVNEWTNSGPWGGKAAWIYINAGTIYTELTAGLYKSTDGGATWEYSYSGVAHDTRSMWCHNNYSAAFPNILYGGC
jgi:hypothetical protein